MLGFRTKKEKNSIELAEFIDEQIAKGFSVVFEPDESGLPVMNVFDKVGNSLMSIYVNRYGRVQKIHKEVKEIANDR